MPHPLLIFSQSGYLIQIVVRNLHTWWQTVQIQISWLLQKPTDLDLHCLQNRIYLGSAGQGLSNRDDIQKWCNQYWPSYISQVPAVLAMFFCSGWVYMISLCFQLQESLDTLQYIDISPQKYVSSHKNFSCTLSYLLSFLLRWSACSYVFIDK